MGMNSENREDRVEKLFQQAKTLSPKEREVFLDRECGGDDSIRTILQRLLHDNDLHRQSLNQAKTESHAHWHGNSGANSSVPSSVDDDTMPQDFEDHDTLPQLAQSAQAGTVFDDYELLEEIARGGMGVVFKAHQKSLNRTVALKMILSGALASTAELRRFEVEAQAIAKLSHPNIVPVYEVGEYQELHFFSMRYVEGQSLRQLIRNGCPRIEEAVNLAKKITEAIAYSHSKGIIHRDLKPANILLNSDNEPMVADFGLAKQFGSESDLTAAGQSLGTPGYMAPEQVEAKNVDQRSDVYGIGAILYELLTGRPPFRAESTWETMALVLDQEPKPPRLLNKRIPEDLNTITLKCLEKDPERRFSSAFELNSELTRFLRREPIESRPISSAERMYRWMVRRPAIAGLIGIATLAVALFGMLVWSHIGDKNRGQNRTSRLRVNVQHDGGISSLANAIPLLNGDAIQITWTTPKKYESVLFWFDTEGKLHELPNPSSADSSEITTQIWPNENELRQISGLPGTEFVFVCARQGAKPTLAELESLLEDESPLPQMQGQAILQVSRTEIDVLDSSLQNATRGPTGENVPFIDNGVRERLKRIQQKLADEFELVKGMAFPHAE